MGMAPAHCPCKLLFLRFKQGGRKSTLRSSNRLELRQVAGRHQGQARQTSNTGLTAPAARNTHHFPDSKAGNSTARISVSRTDGAHALQCTTSREADWKYSILHLQFSNSSHKFTRESSAQLGSPTYGAGRKHGRAERGDSTSQEDLEVAVVLCRSGSSSLPQQSGHPVAAQNRRLSAVQEGRSLAGQ